MTFFRYTQYLEYILDEYILCTTTILQQPFQKDLTLPTFHHLHYGDYFMIAIPHTRKIQSPSEYGIQYRILILSVCV